MTSTKKLDTFVLIDELNLNEGELDRRAEIAARDRADAFGWHEVSIRRSSKLPDSAQKGLALHHYFDIYGVGEAISSVPLPGEQPGVVSTPAHRAAKESTL